jgi:hypothetical protein
MSRLANPRAWIAHLNCIGAACGLLGQGAARHVRFVAAILGALALSAVPAHASDRISAQELERQLRERGMVVLDGKTVVGDFIFSGHSLAATDVTFAGRVAADSDLDSGTLDLEETRFKGAVDLST